MPVFSRFFKTVFFTCLFSQSAVANIYNNKKNYYLEKVSQVLPESSLSTHLYKYSNGLTLIVVPQTKNSFSSLFTVVNAGSNKEIEKKDAGIAHFLEHLFFLDAKGSKNQKFEQELVKLGAEFNAHTYKRYVRFYINFPAPVFDEVLKLQGNMFKNLEINSTSLENERNIVLNERSISLDKDDIFSKTSESLNKILYQKTPYEESILGPEENIKSFTAKQLYDFYSQHYSPRNTIFIVVGKFNPDDIAEKIYQEFKNWKGKSENFEQKYYYNTNFSNYICFDKNLPINRYSFVFKKERFSEEDIIYFEILNYILTIKSNSFINELYDKDYISDFYLYYNTGSGIINDQTEFNFETNNTKNFSFYKNAIFNKLDEIKNTKFTSYELNKMKDYLIKNTALSYEKNFNIAENITFNYFTFKSTNPELKFSEIISNLNNSKFSNWIEENFIKNKYYTIKFMQDKKLTNFCKIDER
ncbi:pitrilysin family protein [Pigmentibacter sp. JX0631]|uniref:M16 family metallopeptidase n=1 Tax=Pigmentibacter sp. JX0631 TaxID=2976982 RepID=UPI0024689E60|nr:pitrilysin family protein [Pigmentibacter sp. JX0631]WGL60984.1 pitrilysin family protein [Pigmentibacter sp. JX0631]